jgi:hypothetical protein
MRFLRPASEDEVVAAFLRAEADEVGRYREAILQRLASEQEALDTVSAQRRVSKRGSNS